MASETVAGEFPRPLQGHVFEGCEDFSPSRRPGWQSSGGPSAKHPDQALPRTLTAKIETTGEVTAVTLVGVFAQYAEHEDPFAVGAHLFGTAVDGSAAWTLPLVASRHYGVSTEEGPHCVPTGDGGVRRKVGTVSINGQQHRVDALTLPVPAGTVKSVTLRDAGTPASFLVFDVYVATRVEASCPFRGKGGQISLSEIPSLIRLNDAHRVRQAIEQLRAAILNASEDLDDARGSGLTFLAMVGAGLLELGVSTKFHRTQLEAARKLDSLQDRESIAAFVCDTALGMVSNAMPADRKPTDRLMDQALRIIEQEVGNDIESSEVADRVGLSTSHFRHLFRERTGQPYSKYMTALRLERARERLLGTKTPIGDIAESLGFVSAAHFSRAFAQRFGVAPSMLRATGEITSNSEGSTSF